MRKCIIASALFIFASVTLVPAAFAEPTVLVKRFDLTKTKARWTAEALASAKARELPRVEFDPERVRLAAEKIAVREEPFEEIFPSLAEGPTLSAAERARFSQKLFDFTDNELRLLRREKPTPLLPSTKNYGTGGLDYTSSRLIPSSAVRTFPYSAVGKLFFSDGTTDFVCSGAIITKRLVVTAGHCVHDGPAGGFFEDFLFVPAYQRGDAPFGAWSATTAFVLDSWADSGEIPHPEDYAILEMEDLGGERIADVTGKLSFVSNFLADNHLTMLGYPVNLDSGEEIHQVTSGDWFDFDDGTVAYGSDMSGGSSGGPWVQNFNRKAQGQGGGRNRARAAVVGVTSYGFLNDAVRAQGASNLLRNFKVLRQDACRNQAGNC